MLQLSVLGNLHKACSDYVIEVIPLTSSLVDNYPILPTNVTDGRNLQQVKVEWFCLSENKFGIFWSWVGGYS